MDAVTLSGSPEVSPVDPTKCIVCQTTSGEKVLNNSNGRKRIREASEVRNDDVSKRLQQIADDSFVYHMNNDCYKSYTMASTLKSILKRKSLTNTQGPSTLNDNGVSVEKLPRYQAARNPPKTATTLRDVNCIICDKKSYKKNYSKYRICESNRASSFLSATAFFQDDVFVRTCDLQDPSAVFGADLYYHKDCMTTYLYKYDTRDRAPKPEVSRKRLAWNEIADELEQGIKDGKGYELSVIRDKLNKIDEKCNFRNRDVKVFLMDQFGNAIDFTYPSARNKSIMVFSVPNSVLAEHIRSVDPVQVCATVIREALNAFDFGLEDSFCDAHDLKHALSHMNIPEPVLRFFGHLYNFNPATYNKAAADVMTEDTPASEAPDDDSDDPHKLRDDGALSGQRCRKVQSLFQVMYYVHHQGRRRTPMHIMNAESVHSLGRGGKIVTQTLNHEGLAISYPELRRYQCDLASFTAQHNRDRVGLPSHFDPGQFTSGAIDNWDHEGANVSEHDTVTVLFQDKPPSSIHKPKISDTEVKHGPQAFKEVLPCQVLSDFHKPARRPDIPTTYDVQEDVYTSSTAGSAKLKDLAWSLARLDFSADKVSIYPQSQMMPSWSASNSTWTEEDIPEKNLAFLPVLPHPVTQYSTVYTAMKNFMEINSQLVQNEIPMYCDEGVYCIVREIQLLRPDEFRALVPCLGTFHLIKTVLKCIGKSLAGSGAEVTWLEAGVFGPTVIENSVLNGGHYGRCLEGMQSLGEAFERLLYQEFFAEQGIHPYTQELAILKDIQSAVEKKDITKSQKCMDKFQEKSLKLVDNLDKFIKARSESNENFKFWATFLDMMTVVRDLLRADREGLWELHLDAVQRALYLFTAYDSTNYLRWCSLYLEDMRRLPETAPSVYENFAKGNFSIKEKPGRFTAVGGDQKLEQSINLSTKCCDGVIGHAKQKQYVAQWDLIYHEMMAVKNLHRQYANVMDRTHETYSHHESSQSTTDHKESQLQRMMQFIDEKGSPLAATSSTTLQNYVTKEVMTDNIRKDMLSALKKGEERYLEFRKERLVEKTARISSTIHRANLKTMKTIHNKQQKTIRSTVREMNIAERNIEIARERGLKTEDLLQYDVVPSPVLFDNEGMMTKPAKSLLIKELEANLKPEDYNYNHRNNSAFVLDVMANVRKVNLSKLSTFQDLLATFISTSEGYRRFGRCDFVFDMYPDKASVKDSERKRRAEKVPIEYTSIDPSSQLPKHMDSFWPSNSNKDLLEKLIYKYICSSVSPMAEYPTVLGQVTGQEEEWQCRSIYKGVEKTLPHLQSNFEEADLRIPLHVLDCIENEHRVCVVITSDTDVIVALLYHMPVFLGKGLEELWVRAGVGETTRYVPLHTMYTKLGHDLCRVLPAVHSLTGCDITSKVGTKKTALKANPERLLRHFGKLPTLSQPTIRDAEQYLVKVFRPVSKAKNFSAMREEVFHHTKGTSHHNLPPTSQGLLPHIKRSYYNAYSIIHALEMGNEHTISLMAEDFGYKCEKDHLVPETSWKSLEPHWTVVCSCTACARATCLCRAAETRCVNFCHCKTALPLSCKNPF